MTTTDITAPITADDFDSLITSLMMIFEYDSDLDFLLPDLLIDDPKTIDDIDFASYDRATPDPLYSASLRMIALAYFRMTRSAIADQLIAYDCCPQHRCDIDICRDDDDPQCRPMRAILFPLDFS